MRRTSPFRDWQTYEDFVLEIHDDATPGPAVRDIAGRYVASDSRVKLVAHEIFTPPMSDATTGVAHASARVSTIPKLSPPRDGATSAFADSSSAVNRS